MQIIKPQFIIEERESGLDKVKALEKAARVCYKSEDKITEDSYEKMLKNIIKRGHTSVLEHEKITVRIICDRGVSHELVRHRIASFSQESTRYCNYSNDKSEGVKVIDIASGFNYDMNNPLDKTKYEVWLNAMDNAERSYNDLIDLGATPQEARSVLPNSTKTEVVMTLNIRSWRNFFSLRADKAAHPQMREIAYPMLKAFHEYIPVVFDDLYEEKCEDK